MAKKRRKRKHSKGFSVFLAVVFVLVLVVCYMLYRNGYLDDYLGGHDHSSSSSADVIETGELSIHFPMLGNANTGDCTLIKTGNTEVLIDAGSRKNSAETIKAYVDAYCEDGVLEYVIATHAHQDHIAGFVGNKSGSTRTGIFYQYEIGTLIQFSKTEVTSGLYEEYCTAVSALEENGTKVYTALDCYNETNGAKRSYELSEGITLNILYQCYYEEKASSENDYSVCTLLSQGNNHYLFTGDLEEKGESSLVEKNELPRVKLFKAGHHGSTTSSSDTLLSVIRPEIVCVCCCCGNMEYAKDPLNDFPSQDFTNRVARYTDRIYVTTITAENEKKFKPMNGNIVVSSAGGDVTVRCSENDVYFKDTEWFKANRTWPEYGVCSP